MQLIQEVTGVNSNFANRLQRQKTAEDSFFFHVTLTRSTGELQQLKAIRWSVGIESHVSFQEKQNKTNAARKYSCWLDTKKPLVFKLWTKFSLQSARVTCLNELFYEGRIYF